MNIKSHSGIRIGLTIVIASIAVLGLFYGVNYGASASENQPAGITPDGPPPTMINYQGTIHVDGAIFDGTGYFKFAVVDSPTGDGSMNYWAHDGTASGEPTTYFTLTVDNSLFNVMLGDTSIVSMTQPISHTDFVKTNTYLRVWFSDDGSTFQALEPNQQFASVAYALRTYYAEHYNESDPVFGTSPAAGISPISITNWTTAYGWGNHALAGYDPSPDPWLQVAGDAYVVAADVGIGVSNPLAPLHIKKSTSSSNPLLKVEQTGPRDASIGFRQNMTITDYTTGIDAADLHFKTTNTHNLTNGAGSTQGDGKTLIQAHPSGIIDFNNQSRARAFLGFTPQWIPTGFWTPIAFDFINFDQQGEFFPAVPGPPGGNPCPGSTSGLFPGNSGCFLATEEGYYQIHARTAFTETESQPGPTRAMPNAPQVNGYVSIAIFVTTPQNYPVGVMMAQGNNLQMTDSQAHMLPYNNAPNVSDIVYLQPGDFVEIYAWQNYWYDPTGLTFSWLEMGPDKTYVSIHKDS